MLQWNQGLSCKQILNHLGIDLEGVFTPSFFLQLRTAWCDMKSVIWLLSVFTVVFLGAGVVLWAFPSEHVVLANKIKHMTPEELAKYREDMAREGAILREQKRVAAEKLAEEKRKQDEIKRVAYESSPAGRKEKAWKSIKLVDFEPSREAFRTVLVINVWLKNEGDTAVKDIEIQCRGKAASGTVIDNNRRTLYQVLEPNHSKWHEISMGFLHSQVSQLTCSITDFELM